VNFAPCSEKIYTYSEAKEAVIPQESFSFQALFWHKKGFFRNDMWEDG